MPSEDAELDALLQRMSPDIADLMLRMMKKDELTWEKARAFRDEIVELNKNTQTDEEQSALVFAFNSLMNQVEEFDLIDPSSLDHFRNVREADYKMMLSVQAMIGDHIDPDRLECITRREVEAGRLSADDKFRQLAVSGATVLGTRAGNAPKRGSWLGRLFRKS
jgi:polyhydroxyalkanoate synthesis regulator phasin